MGASRGPVALLQPSVTNHIPYSQPDPNRFDRDRLFSVVSRGVPEDLAGLPEYLRRTSKYLTDSEYTGRRPCGPEPRHPAACAQTGPLSSLDCGQEPRGGVFLADLLPPFGSAYASRFQPPHKIPAHLCHPQPSAAARWMLVRVLNAFFFFFFFFLK